MFVCNISLNKTRIVKTFFVIVCIVLIIFFFVSVYKIISKSLNSNVKDTLPNPDVIQLTAENYTNVLKTVHDNLDTYVGKKISFTGYVYKLANFDEKQFVLARDMVINSNLQTLVVGFLCNCNNAKEFENGTWVEITGKIIKGKYYEEIPIIEITNIKKIEKPSDVFVYPPDDSFVPTINLF
jgi:putative membrane protein